MKLTDLKLLVDIAYYEATTGRHFELPTKGFMKAAVRMRRRGLVLISTDGRGATLTASGEILLGELLDED
jgi:hypothetical protein